MPFDFDHHYAQQPVILAPMEDVSDAVFRRLCRARGADLCVTEFVNVEGLLRGCKQASRKLQLDEADHPTAIQIYGSDETRLAEAAVVAEEAEPVFVDINCGCWVPKIARRGAGAGWLRDPAAMIAMAELVVKAVSMPVTVKTRIGYGPESEMPIVDLARRLEDVGVRALTIHCRTAKMAYTGEADWSWAAKAQAVVSMPVIVNGDIKTVLDAKRALDETGAAGVMIGRGAMTHPWIIGECRTYLEDGTLPDVVPWRERLQLCREHLSEKMARRGDLGAIRAMRRYYPGYLRGLPGGKTLKHRLNRTDGRDEVFGLFDEYEAYLVEREAQGRAIESAA